MMNKSASDFRVFPSLVQLLPKSFVDVGDPKQQTV
jgi:hypothetical protein